VEFRVYWYDEGYRRRTILIHSQPQPHYYHDYHYSSYDYHSYEEDYDEEENASTQVGEEGEQWEE